ncbi:head-to-tail terminator [Gordonia phage Faith5x5]|nr:head-to-tail terminator [Gordonia phage Faith5x5]
MAFTTSSEVIEALGRKMAALNLVEYLDDPGAVFTEGSALLAFIDGLLPPEPDTCVSAIVTRDDRERDPFNPDIDVRLRFRAAVDATKTADDWADATYAAVHVPDHVVRGDKVWPGGVRVLDVRRVMRALSFSDTNGRSVRADDYRITLNPKE